MGGLGAVLLKDVERDDRTHPSWLSSLQQPITARPFLRWAGGKTRLLSCLLPYVPARFANYHEPFLGAAAVFFAVANRATEQCYLSDLNQDLINAWIVARDRPKEFIKALRRFEGRDSEAEYYRIRDASPRGEVQRAARFFYLNQTSWNALWRVNRFGVFNVPWGARPFRGISPQELLTVSAFLRGVKIANKDFRESLKSARKGDFVYLDPPYLPISDTSKFSGYTERRFRVTDLAELADCCRDLSARGVRWVLSNRDNARVRQLFSFARIVSLTTRRSVAAQNRRDIEPTDSPEAIIIGGPRL